MATQPMQAGAPARPTLQQDNPDAWNRIADGFDAYVTSPNAELGEYAIKAVGVAPGDRFLDVAAGSGALSLPAARLGAQVLATDFAPKMVSRLQARADAEGLANVEARVMDGTNLELEDNSFDVAGSQFGVMLFPDMPQGLREIARVTRPGGRVALVVMGPPGEQEFLTFFLGALQSAVPDFKGLPTDPPPLPFQLSDPAMLKAEMERSGLSDVRTMFAPHDLSFESADEMWDFVTHSNPIGAMMLADLPDALRAAAKQKLGEMLAQRSGGVGPAVINNKAIIGIGTK